MPVSFDNIPVGSQWTRQSLANAWGYRGYQAFARGVFTPQGDDKIILFVSEQKPGDFTQYEDEKQMPGIKGTPSNAGRG